MHLTLGDAARQAGLSKSTLSRANKDGKLTALRSDDTGSYRIELSELQRYREAAAVIHATTKRSAARQAATAQEHRDVAVLQAQNDGLQQMIGLLRTQLSDIMKQRDSWQAQAERLALPRPDRSAAEIVPMPRPATGPVLQLATGLAQLSNPLAHIWKWLADQLNRATVSKPDQLGQATAAGKPTVPANLARFGHGCLAPAGEPRGLDRATLLRELERELAHNATPGVVSPSRNSLAARAIPQARDQLRAEREAEKPAVSSHAAADQFA